MIGFVGSTSYGLAAALLTLYGMWLAWLILGIGMGIAPGETAAPACYL
jgi:hypothetical protein